MISFMFESNDVKFTSFLAVPDVSMTSHYFILHFRALGCNIIGILQILLKFQNSIFHGSQTCKMSLNVLLRLLQIVFRDSCSAMFLLLGSKQKCFFFFITMGSIYAKTISDVFINSTDCLPFTYYFHIWKVKKS